MNYLNHLSLICALGSTHAEIRSRLREGDSGLIVTDRYSPGSFLPLGCALDWQTGLDAALPLSERSRNNQLLLAALVPIRAEVEALIARHGPARIGIVIGTSTSGIAETERALAIRTLTGLWPADYHYSQQELASPAMALARTLKTCGPTYVHSSACASSAKALMSAARLLTLGVCDAVLVGGVDSLTELTVAGFRALASVSMTRCNPLSVNRDGINIGEGAALFIMTQEPARVALCGWGESMDAHHISAPDPHGKGASLAVLQALRRANLEPGQIDYINLHGTATRQNDAMESRLVAELFAAASPKVSSSKALTGHALGAAGAIEAGLCWLCMQDDNDAGDLPVHLWDEQQDPALPRLNVVKARDPLGQPPRFVLSHSFAFGGSNAVLLLGRS